MKPSRYATSRQKACQNCSTAKAKCDRHPQRCGRCAQRGLNCAYPHELARSPDASADGSRHCIDNTAISPGGGRIPLSGASPGYLGHSSDGQASTTPREPIVVFVGSGDGTSPTLISSEAPGSPPPAPAAPAASNGQNPTSDSPSACVDLELVCPINADYISTRWLNQYVPVEGQVVKNFPDHIKAFMPRILGSYASMAVRGRQIPPFIHPAQMQPPLARSPLSTCLSLVRSKQLLDTILAPSRSKFCQMWPVPQRTYHTTGFETGLWPPCGSLLTVLA
jgi:hypothetical protein